MEDGGAETQQHVPAETPDRRRWRRATQTRYHGNGLQVSGREALFGPTASDLFNTYIDLKEDWNRGGEEDFHKLKYDLYLWIWNLFIMLVNISEFPGMVDG